MKRKLIICFFYFFSTLVYADQCPEPTNGNFFIGAYWFGTEKDPYVPVRCDYTDQQIFTKRPYGKSDLTRHKQVWVKVGIDPDSWYQCDYHDLVDECPFGY